MDQNGEVLLSQALYEIFRGFNSYIEVLKYFDDIKAGYYGRIDQFAEWGGDDGCPYFARYISEIVKDKKARVRRKEIREKNQELEKKY